MPTMKFTTAKDKNKKNNNYNNISTIITTKTTIADSTAFSNTHNSIIINHSNNNNTSKKFLKCTLCNFSCLYSSQMIQHNLKNHTSQIFQNSKNDKKITSSENSSINYKRKISIEDTTPSKKKKVEISSELSTNSIDSKSTRNSLVKSEKKQSTTELSTTTEVYACKECEYFNPIKKNYERHMWCHTSDFPFKCKHCSFSSNAENAVQRHITQYHTAIKRSITNALKDQHNLKNSNNQLLNIKKEPNDPEYVPKINGLISPTLPVTLANDLNINKEVMSGDLLKCIIIKTRTKDNQISWTCHSCEITSSSSSSMHQHTTSLHHTPLHECVTIIQDYYIINGTESKEVRESMKGVACAHCGFEAVNTEAMKTHLRDDCTGIDEGKGDESDDEGEQRSLSLVLEKSEADAKGKGPLGKFSKALNDMMDKFTSFYGSSSKKLYLVCFMCKYKTYSMKVLKKHLVREHVDIITHHKQLNSLSRKCLFYSLKYECKLINKALVYNNKHIKEPPLLSEDEDGSDEEEEDALLKIQAISDHDEATQNHSIDLNDPKSSDTYKRKILEVFKHEGEFNKVFECSVCGKKVFFKCNLKKHVESTHPKAKIIQLSLVDGTLSHDDLIKFHKKHRVNKLKKLLSKRGITKNELSALHSLISDELGGQAMEYMLDRSEISGDEKVGMIDDLRLKRFQCGVCSFRSNFRSDISRHLKVKHPTNKNSYYTVLSIEKATESLEKYNQARPNIDMRYTKQRNNTLSSSTSIEKDLTMYIKGSNRFSTEIVTKTNIEIPPTEKFNHLQSMFSSSNDEHYAFYQSLPYNVRRLNLFEDFLKCNICPFYTFKPTSFKVHKSCHQTTNRSSQHSCPHCPFFVSTKRLFEKHLQLHTQYAISQAARISSYTFKSGNITAFTSSINSNYAGNSYTYDSNYISDYLLYSHQNYKSAHLRFCQHKYICPQCPFKTNHREDFWSHGKFHFGGRSSDFKCDQCPFYATDKRGLVHHSTLHNKGYTPKANLDQSDLVRGEFCRCDLADFLKQTELACFKQLSCLYCSYSNNSVRLLRQHIASHVPLTNSYTTPIFSPHLDNADDLLGILCTRLLNMNYSLVEEAQKKGNEEKGDENGCDNEMPILEKFTDLPSPELYNPHQSISVASDQLPLKPPIKVINLYNNSIKHLGVDNKAPKIIKITTHLSNNINNNINNKLNINTNNSLLPSPSLPKLTPSITPSLISPPMPHLKVSKTLMEIKENKKIDSDSFEATLPIKVSEKIETLMQSGFLSAPEEVIAEEDEEIEDCTNYFVDKENEKEKKNDICVNNQESMKTCEDVVCKDECQSAKRIFMLSLGLVRR